MRDNVIGPRKPKEFSKSQWECKVKKRAEEAQGKTNGTRELASDVIIEPVAILGH